MVKCSIKTTKWIEGVSANSRSKLMSIKSKLVKNKIPTKIDKGKDRFGQTEFTLKYKLKKVSC